MRLGESIVGGAEDLASYATRARWEDIQKHWKLSTEDLNIPLWPLVAAGVMIAGVVLGVWAWRQFGGASSCSAGVMTFHRIAKQIGVSLGDQWLLFRISQRQSLATPLTLMLSRGTLQHHGKEYLAHLGPRRRARVGARIRGLETLLFGDLRG